MKLIIQRVTRASVTIDGNVSGSIGKGYMVLIGIGREDTEETVRKYADKMLKLRIFEDENGKTNLSLAQVDGELIPVALTTVVAVTAEATHTVATTFGGHRPLLEHGEGRSAGVARGAHGNAKVFGSVAVILCTGIEADAAAQSNLR